MLPVHRPDDSPIGAVDQARRHLSAVPTAGEDVSDLPYEHGLLRAALIGGAIGFAVVFALVCGGLSLTDLGLAYALPSAVFVAAFGGFGFGAMQAAALHRPRRS